MDATQASQALSAHRERELDGWLYGVRAALRIDGISRVSGRTPNVGVRFSDLKLEAESLCGLVQARVDGEVLEDERLSSSHIPVTLRTHPGVVAVLASRVRLRQITVKELHTYLLASDF